MRFSVLGRVAAVAAAGSLILAPGAGAAPRLKGGAAVSAGTVAGPRLVLIAAQTRITLSRWHGYVSLDPGIWVASLGGDFRIEVQRTSYTRPITATQVIRRPRGRERRRLPARVLDGWNGLAHFFRFVVTDSRGRIAASGSPTFCPNSPGAQRASPAGGVADPYPRFCSAIGNPFQLGSVWGIRNGWAVDPFDLVASNVGYPLAPGRYTLTATITARYRRLFDVPVAQATAAVQLIVRNGGPPPPPSYRPPTPPPTWRTTRPRLLTEPPRTALPDLVALPAWRVNPYRSGHRDYMSFNAGVWVRNAPLDVQGFRSNGSPVMQAYQYFWLHGRVIGRMPVGTMGFDDQPGHHHWHFEQFARYLLQRPDGSVVAIDPKVGFCLGPSEAINLLLPGVMFQPPFHEPAGGCGTPTNLWVDEELPPGWDDTYPNSVAGQSFDISDVPNGRYQIAIVANPLGVLDETTTSNDTSLRTVILGGRRGHRTVQVPAWNGIDPEQSAEYGP